MFCCCNSGISCVIGPNGRDVALLEVGGQAKSVRGTLRVTVPVPLRDGEGEVPATLYVLTEPLQLWAWAGLILLLTLIARRQSVTPRSPAGKAADEIEGPPRAA